MALLDHRDFRTTAHALTQRGREMAVRATQHATGWTKEEMYALKDNAHLLMNITLRGIEKAEGKSKTFKAMNNWVRTRTPTQSFFAILGYEAVGAAIYGTLIYKYGWEGVAAIPALWYARQIPKACYYPALLYNARRSYPWRGTMRLLKKHKFYHATPRTALRLGISKTSRRKNRQRYSASKQWAKREKGMLGFQAAYQSTWFWPLAFVQTGHLRDTYYAITAVCAPYIAENVHRIGNYSKRYRAVAERIKPIAYRAFVPALG